MPPQRPAKLVAQLLSDVGMVREHNEDAAFVDPEGAFFVVADGMGGHAAGEVASAMAVEQVAAALGGARDRIARFADSPSEEARGGLVQLLEDAVRKAHQAVFERGAKEADKKGMGTTLDVLLVAGGEGFVAHVGDSRTYLLRGGTAAQVTTDHTVAEVLVIEGKLSPDEARTSPLRTILVNAIGVSADVGVELAHLKLRRGDQLLLCSDGMHDYYPSESEIADILRHEAGAAGLKTLVELAKSRGGHDNITGVLVEVVDGNPTVDEEAAAAKQAAAELSAQDAADRAAAPAGPMGTESTQPHGVASTRRAPPQGVTRLPGASAKAQPAMASEAVVAGAHAQASAHAEDDPESEFGGGTLPGIGPVPPADARPAGDKRDDASTSRTEELPAQTTPPGKL